MLAEVALRLGRNVDAGNLLARCLELAPGFAPARHNYAIALHRQARPADALREIERALEADPRNPGYRNLQAAILGRIGEFDRAIEVYAGVLREYPQQPKVWMSYGHALKAAGRQADSIGAYRKSIELAPELRRGLVEPRQPQDVPVHRRRDRHDAPDARPSTTCPTRTACTSSSRSARRRKMPACMPRPSPTTPEGNRLRRARRAMTPRP